VTTLAAPLGIFTRHPGRRARHGPVRHAITVVHVTAAIAAAGIITSGVLLAGHPHLPATAPHCVPWLSCGCRYPGAPAHLNGNQLCVTQNKSGADVVTGNNP
jgi:hypothetical protein